MGIRSPISTSVLYPRFSVMMISGVAVSENNAELSHDKIRLRANPGVQVHDALRNHSLFSSISLYLRFAPYSSLDVSSRPDSALFWIGMNQTGV